MGRSDDEIDPPDMTPLSNNRLAPQKANQGRNGAHSATIGKIPSLVAQIRRRENTFGETLGALAVAQTCYALGAIVPASGSGADASVVEAPLQATT